MCLTFSVSPTFGVKYISISFFLFCFNDYFVAFLAENSPRVNLVVKKILLNAKNVKNETACNVGIM